MYKLVLNGDESGLLEELRNGGNINERILSIAMWTPLMVACYAQNERMVEFLLENGANVHIRNKEMETACTIAMRGGNDNIVKMLFKSGSLNTFEVSWIPFNLKSHRFREIYAMVPEDKKPMFHDGKWLIFCLNAWRSLQLDQNMFEIFKFFLEIGCDPNTDGGTGVSALSRCMNSNIPDEYARLLILFGAVGNKNALKRFPKYNRIKDAFDLYNVSLFIRGRIPRVSSHCSMGRLPNVLLVEIWKCLK